jgi:hypothetical protein
MSELERKIDKSGAFQVGHYSAKIHPIESLDCHRCDNGAITITILGKENYKIRARLWLNREQAAYLAASMAGPSDSAALLATRSVYVVYDKATGGYVDGSSERTLIGRLGIDSNVTIWLDGDF